MSPRRVDGDLRRCRASPSCSSRSRSPRAAHGRPGPSPVHGAASAGPAPSAASAGAHHGRALGVAPICHPTPRWRPKAATRSSASSGRTAGAAADRTARGCPVPRSRSAPASRSPVRSAATSRSRPGRRAGRRPATSDGAGARDDRRGRRPDRRSPRRRRGTGRSRSRGPVRRRRLGARTPGGLEVAVSARRRPPMAHFVRHATPPPTRRRAPAAGRARGGRRRSVAGMRGTGPPPSADLGGLLVLAGDPGDAALRAWAAGATPDDDRAVETPEGHGLGRGAAGRTSWSAALVDGSPADERPDRPPTRTRPGARSRRPARTATRSRARSTSRRWDPEGGRFAALAGDLDAEPRLTLIDPSARQRLRDRPRTTGRGGAAGVGRDGPRRDRGRRCGRTGLDPRRHDDRRDPRRPGRRPPVRDVGRWPARSPWSAGDGDTIAIRSTEGWLAGDGSSIGSIDAPPGIVAPTALALDADGHASRGGVARRRRRDAVAVHERAAGWRRVREPRSGQGRGRGGGLAALTPDRASGRRDQAVGTGSGAAKIETWASSGSMTPKTFWRVRRWTHDPQVSK